MHATDRTDAATGPSPIDDFAALHRLMITVACFTATVSSALLYDVLPPIMADLAQHFGGGTTGKFIAQLAGTLPLFGVMAAGLVVGPCIERFGLRTVLLVAMALFAFAGSSGVVIDAPSHFLGARLLTGVAAGLMTTACNSLITIYFRGPARTRINGMIIGAGAVGGIVFVLIAGFAASWWWRGPFLLHGAVTLAFLPAVLLAGRVPASPRPQPGVIGNLRRLRPMVPVCLVGFAWFAIMLMGSTQTPFQMAGAGLSDHRLIGSLYALNAASVSISSLVAGRIAPRFATGVVLRGAFLLAAAGLCITGASAQYAQFAAGMVVSGTSVGFGLTAIWTWGMQSAPRDIVPRSLGAMTTSLYLGGALSPFLSLPFRALLGTRGQFFGVAGAIVAAVALAWIAWLRVGRDVAQAVPELYDREIP